MQEEMLTLKQAYLSMCEYLYKELELNNWKDVSVRSILAEVELEDEWNSTDPNAVLQFEEVVKAVLVQGSRFDVRHKTPNPSFERTR
jgi:hypothetical protein